MDYKTALMIAMTNKELVKEYDRLFDRQFGEVIKSITTGGINYQIDLSTGRIKDEIQKFDEFFYEFIWSPLDYVLKNQYEQTLSNP